MDFVNHSTVELIKYNASDEDVAYAAWVSNFAAEARNRDTARIGGLINFLYANKHMSPFEHGSFTFFIDTTLFVAREFMRHRTFCLDGETSIAFTNGKSKTIAEHWEHWNLGVPDSLGRRRVLPSVKSSKVWSINEENLDHIGSTVLDVIKGEPKEMFEIETYRGFKITASADHKFFTGSDWLTVKEIVEDSTPLMVRHKTLSSDDTHQKATPTALRAAINQWSGQQKDFIVERDGALCSCGAPGSVVDHVIPVAQDLKRALDIDNLQLLCKVCDRAKTTTEQKLADRNMRFTMVGPDVVRAVKPVGIRDSYDLVLDAPHHNFLGNGIVTHNSYNETSGRYKEMEGRFYLPPFDRPLVQKGKVGAYTFEPGTQEQHRLVVQSQKNVFNIAWREYQFMLRNGIAKEVARNVLPLGLYTQFYATANPRNIMQFLILRNDKHALWEIRDVAVSIEAEFAKAMPLTYAAFDKERTTWRKIQRLLEIVNLDKLLADIDPEQENVLV